MPAPINQFIGRRVSVGLGIEATPGTDVAPTIWMKQLGLDFQRQTTVIDNDSAMGRVEKTNDSAVVEQWADGKIDGKVQDISIGYLLYNLFGTLVTSANADASGTIKDHTLDIANTNIGKPLTLVRKDPITNRRHGLATLADMEISTDAAGWVKFTSSLKAKAGVAGSDVATYLAENEFTSKHVTIKIAPLVAGLAASTAPLVKSFKLRLSKDSATPFIPLGAIDPIIFNTGSWAVTGEAVLQYTDTTLEDIAFANTMQAMSLAIVNTDVTIGTSAKPGLVFTMPRVRLNSFNMNNDLEAVVEQTVGFKAEIDPITGYMIRCVLTNTRTSY